MPIGRRQLWRVLTSSNHGAMIMRSYIASQLYHTLGAHSMGQDRTLAMMIVHGFMLCPCCTNIHILIYIYIYTYILVPRSRMSTSQQCAFASAGLLLWNCLPVKTRAQILSSSLSSTPRLLKSFLFPGAYRTEGRL